MSDVINVREKLSTFQQHWSPRTVAVFNQHDVMVVKVEGEFVWHKRDDTDDFFFVLKGELDIELRERTVTLTEGEIFIVPRCRAQARRPERRGPSAPYRTIRHAKHWRPQDGSPAHPGLISRKIPRG